MAANLAHTSLGLGDNDRIILILPMIFVVGKQHITRLTPVKGDYDGLAQLKDMRDSLEEDDGYSIANTMSTPMLVNDWKYPHRTMLLVIAPEKPIDETEAESIYDFVTESGGKVIVAADGTNEIVRFEVWSHLLRLTIAG